MKTRALLCIGFILCVLADASLARTWTSTDGRTLDAVFVEADAESVTIKRTSDGMTFTLQLDKISDADREFVSRKLEQMKASAPSAGFGDYAEQIKGEWVKGEFRGVPYQIYGPPKVEGDTLLPLVVVLHGAGERGDDNEQQLTSGPKSFVKEGAFKERPCFVIAPQCPEGGGWTGGTGDTVVKFINDLGKELPIDEDRIYITGYSMGAYGTWSLLAKEPKLFAAAVPIAGGGNPSSARSIKKVPIWNFHGDADETVSVEGSRKMVEALKKARGNIKYTEMAGEGHGIPGKVWRDEEVHKWIFEQKKP